MSVFPIDSKQRFEYMKYICAYDSYIKAAKYYHFHLQYNIYRQD